MKTNNVIRINLKNLPHGASDARTESARLWNRLVKLHHWFRKRKKPWPTEGKLKKHFKGRFLLHSQTIQGIIEKFLANIETTKTNRKQGNKRARYPWRRKKYVNTIWKGQSIKRNGNRLILPMGRGRSPLAIKISNLPEGKIAQVELAFRALLITLSREIEIPKSGAGVAAVDLGVIHLAVITNGKKTEGIIGRGLRSIIQGQNKVKAEITSLRSRCKNGSRRWKKLRRARGKISRRSKRIQDNLLHHAANRVVNFCQDQQVGTLVVGDITEMSRGKKKKMSKRTNQENSGNPLGQFVGYLEYKLERIGTRLEKIGEQYTSQTCPVCGHRHKPAGRVYKCRACGFIGVRDEVGAINILNKYRNGEIVPGQLIPSGKVKYLRPVKLRNVVEPLTLAQVA